MVQNPISGAHTQRLGCRQLFQNILPFLLCFVCLVLANSGFGAPSGSTRLRYEKDQITSNLDTLPPGSQVAVQLDKMNVLYIGIDNPVHIVVKSLKDEEWYVKLNGEGALTGAGGNYTVQVKAPGTVTLEVYQKSGKGDVLIDSQTFRVKRIPDPTPKFGAMHSMEVTKEFLASRDLVLTAELFNFDFDASCKIVGSTLTFLPKGENPSPPIPVPGDSMPENIRAQILALPEGSALFIDDIKCKCPGDAAARNLGGLAYRIIEKE